MEAVFSIAAAAAGAMLKRIYVEETLQLLLLRTDLNT